MNNPSLLYTRSLLINSKFRLNPLHMITKYHNKVIIRTDFTYGFTVLQLMSLKDADANITIPTNWITCNVYTNHCVFEGKTNAIEYRQNPSQKKFKGELSGLSVIVVVSLLILIKVVTWENTNNH